MKSILTTLFSILITSGLYASPQSPDFIVIGKDTIGTYNLLLEKYLQNTDSNSTGQLFGLTFRKSNSMNCWRGYQAIYTLQNDSLFLTDIIECGELLYGSIDKEKSLEKIKAIFGDKFKNERVFIFWFDGIFSYPLTPEIIRWDGVFYKIFEKEKVIYISKGHVTKTMEIDNYIDDPKRIDRRDKYKISDVLFKEIKKEKWKNKMDYDCGNGYWITINEKGIVTKVAIRFYEDGDTPIEDNEENYCVNKVYNALKDLKFDVIKDKGMPIMEEIFIEIWQEDNGRIKNWTR
jgi:hypothetical protein